MPLGSPGALASHNPAPDAFAVQHRRRRSIQEPVMVMFAQINLSIRNPGHRPPYVKAVVWPYAPPWTGSWETDAFSRPGRGPGTLRIAVPPPSDTPSTVEHFLFILASEVSSLYEFPVPDDYFVLPGQQRRDYVVAWLHDRVAALGIDRRR